MSLLLDLLDPSASPAVVRPALLLLVAALLGRPRNARVFERADGLATVAALFRAREASREVRMQALEFFYFYLMPEAPEGHGVRTGGRAGAGRVPSDASVSDAGEGGGIRSTAEKQALLGRYVPNVQELVDDLAESGPFGGGGGGGGGEGVVRAPGVGAAVGVV